MCGVEKRLPGACVRQPRPVCVHILLKDVGCHGCVSKRSVRFGSGYSEMSGANDSKAVLSCERPEERSAFACLLPPGSGDGQPE